MLRTNPTRVDLKSEDLREYEEIKKTWPKNIQNQTKDYTIYETHFPDPEKKNRNNRIGLKDK